MKKLLILCLTLVMGTGLAMAEKPAQKKNVTTVFVTDIDCEHCVKKIMNNVPSLGKGIKDVQVDLAKKEVTVVYDASKNSDENIVKGFATLKVKAEPKAAAGDRWRTPKKTGPPITAPAPGTPGTGAASRSPAFSSRSPDTPSRPGGPSPRP